MIHPSQLTKEAGFEEGVVVEYEYPEWGTGPLTKFFAIFDKVEGNEVWSTDHEGHGYTELSLIHSIRPLTGYMAIWNHAPEWANYYVNRHDMKSCGFQVDLTGYMRMPPHDEKYKNDWSARPWWATVNRDETRWEMMGRNNVEWININDATPEQWQRVLVSNDEGAVHCCTYKSGSFYSAGVRATDVTFWSEMPNPPVKK